jgi:hypothetical protein
MSRTLQVFVIGQSPRLDIEAQVALVARDTKISVDGVLDGMSLEKIADRVVPESDRDAVFARLETRIQERSRPGVHVVAAALAPHSDHVEVDAAAFQLVAQKPDLAIMDCMSYTRLEMARVSAILSCLVLLPAVVATQAAAALLDMDRT